MMPAMELVPPMPDATLDSQEVQEDTADKASSTEGTLNQEAPGSTTEEEESAEPLGPIVITDPSNTTVIVTTTVNPSATAGKWPTESSDRDDENET